jgi:hypothetical protein
VLRSSVSWNKEGDVPYKGSFDGLGPGVGAELDLSGDEAVSGILSLKPHESKRLIAKAVVKLPEVQRALERGKIIVAMGTTNAYVAEELLGQPVPKYNYAAGFVSDQLDSTTELERVLPYIWDRGRVIEVPLEEIFAQGPTVGFLKQFGAGDVFFKGANAVDPRGHAAVFTNHPLGGTCGGHMGVLWARGCHLIVPVGLEKMIPSVVAAARKGGNDRLKYSTGLKVGIWPIINGTVITEIQAFQVLFGIKATHVGSGGIGGGEGSVVLVVEGQDEAVANAFSFVESLKAEPPIRVAKNELVGTIEQRKQQAK